MTTSKSSAGLLMFRRTPSGPEVFLVHPGGPFFTRKDMGVWSVPKGEIETGEDPLDVARREFHEETGRDVGSCALDDNRVHLGSVRQRAGKVVHVWAFEGDWPANVPVASNTFALEWPPRSGRIQEFPEVDRGEFFPLTEARTKINTAQAELLDRLLEWLEAGERRESGPTGRAQGAGSGGGDA